MPNGVPYAPAQLSIRFGHTDKQKGRKKIFGFFRQNKKNPYCSLYGREKTKYENLGSSFFRQNKFNPDLISKCGPI